MPWVLHALSNYQLRSVLEEDIAPLLARLEGLPDIPGHNLRAARVWLRRAAQAEKTSDFLACLDEVDAALGCKVDDLPPVAAPSTLN